MMHPVKRLRPLRALLSRFHRDERASLSIEAMIVLPFLLWAFAASYAIFDVFRAKTLALRGNYAISDLLSRETNSVNANYIIGTEKLYAFLTKSGTSSWLRVTVVGCTADCDLATRTLSVDWSYGTDLNPALTDTNIANNYDHIIPVMGLGERVIMVETNMSYEPMFSPGLTGIGARNLTDIVMTRPRFVDNLPWSDS